MIMSTTTTNAFDVGALTADRSDRPSIWTRLFRGLVASREAQAKRMVAAQFSRMSDARLADIGLSPDDVRYVRATGQIPRSYWS